MDVADKDDMGSTIRDGSIAGCSSPSMECVEEESRRLDALLAVFLAEIRD